MTENLPTTATPTASGEVALAQRIEYARYLSSANLLPRQYQGNPGNVLYAIEFGNALGVAPVVAINQIHVIEGRPSASASLISALVRKAGHRLRVWVERDNVGRPIKAVATIVRKDDPEFEFRSEWTMERAEAAGLTGKKVWQQFPEAMLKARAITEVAREACEEALNGIGYTPEELGADQAPGGAWTVPTTAAVGVVQENRPGQTIRDAMGASTSAGTPNGQPANGNGAYPTPKETSGEEQPPAPAGGQDERISRAQQQRMAILMRQVGITERDDALALVNQVIGRQVDSRKELTSVEADQVIAALEAQLAAAQESEPVEAEVVSRHPAETGQQVIDNVDWPPVAQPGGGTR